MNKCLCIVDSISDLDPEKNANSTSTQKPTSQPDPEKNEKPSTQKPTPQPDTKKNDKPSTQQKPTSQPKTEKNGKPSTPMVA